MTPNMTRTLAAAVLVGLFAGPGQASTVWQFPYKGAPFAKPHDRAHTHKSVQALPDRKLKQQPGIAQPLAIGERGIVVAHHKPPYHGGP